MVVIIADTDVLVDFLKGRGEADRIALEISIGRCCTTAISAFELWAGARGLQQVAAVDALLAALTIIPLDSSGARRAGEIRRGLESKGTAVGMADSLIAGICLEREGILLTRNRKHFERIPGIRLGSTSG